MLHLLEQESRRLVHLAEAMVELLDLHDELVGIVVELGHALLVLLQPEKLVGQRFNLAAHVRDLFVHDSALLRQLLALARLVGQLLVQVVFANLNDLHAKF